MSKKLATLLGLHIGDSLGATLEFKPASNHWNDHTEIIGGGDFNWRPGDPTDDTDMMICLLKSLYENNGFNLKNIASHYVEWLNTKPTDIGNTTSDALKCVKAGIDLSKSGRSNEDSQGNGGLMRCAPLALFDISDKEIKKECAITHAHPNCMKINLVFIKSLRMIFNGASKEDVYEFALEELEYNQDFYQRFKNIKNLPWHELKTTGYVFDTLLASFWGLLHSETFEEALIKIVNRGDDADTCGAVTGALCGAYYGIESIPKRWLEVIREKESIRSYLL
jgi:ADP-ribosyl-[dinitrogen reductase] hydrolase